MNGLYHVAGARAPAMTGPVEAFYDNIEGYKRRTLHMKRNSYELNITENLTDGMVLGHIYSLQDLYDMVGAKDEGEKHSVRGVLGGRRLGRYEVAYHGDAQYSLERKK